MKKTIFFALRCTAVTLLVAWFAGMAIPYKLTCSALGGKDGGKIKLGAYNTLQRATKAEPTGGPR